MKILILLLDGGTAPDPTALLVHFAHLLQKFMCKRLRRGRDKLCVTFEMKPSAKNISAPTSTIEPTTH